MKIISMRCPDCGASIEYNPKKPLSFCQYCGARIYVDDEKPKKVVHQNINNDYSTYNDYSTHTKIKEKHYHIKEEKQSEIGGCIEGCATWSLGAILLIAALLYLLLDGLGIL